MKENDGGEKSAPDEHKKHMLVPIRIFIFGSLSCKFYGCSLLHSSFYTVFFFVFGGPFLSRSQQNFCMSTVFLFAVSVSVQILVGARFFLSHFGWMYEEHECVPRMLFVIYYENH